MDQRIHRPAITSILEPCTHRIAHAGRHHDEDAASPRRHHPWGAQPQAALLTCSKCDHPGASLARPLRYLLDYLPCLVAQAKLLKEQLEVVKYRDADTGALRYSIRHVEGQLTFDKVKLSMSVAFDDRRRVFRLFRPVNAHTHFGTACRVFTCLSEPSSSCSSASRASSW